MEKNIDEKESQTSISSLNAYCVNLPKEFRWINRHPSRDSTSMQHHPEVSKRHADVPLE